MPTVDLEKLRVALRRMSRRSLLIVAERATELVPRAKLGTLIGDFVRLEDLAAGAKSCSMTSGSSTRLPCAATTTIASTSTRGTSWRDPKGRLGKAFCRRCEYCMPCPQGVMIPMAVRYPISSPDWDGAAPWPELRSRDTDQMIAELVAYKMANYPSDERRIVAAGLSPEAQVQVHWANGEKPIAELFSSALPEAPASGASGRKPLAEKLVAKMKRQVRGKVTDLRPPPLREKRACPPWSTTTPMPTPRRRLAMRSHLQFRWSRSPS